MASRVAVKTPCSLHAACISCPYFSLPEPYPSDQDTEPSPIRIRQSEACANRTMMRGSIATNFARGVPRTLDEFLDFESAGVRQRTFYVSEMTYVRKISRNDFTDSAGLCNIGIYDVYCCRSLLLYETIL
jgi:hypothetical protein